ncbi:hypothetical protein ACFLSA_00795 [Bacteroidota bacterium]
MKDLIFFADIVLSDKETEIIASSNGIYGSQEHRVRVIWDRYSQPRYRFSMDDCIFSFRDIAKNKYKSIFDCHFFRDLQELHSKYGVRFTVNVYFEDEEGFDLTMFPDKYKNEWRDNADWMRLAFHANAQGPPRPYQYASASSLIRDLDKVSEQIIRFAGEESYALPTVVHYAELHPTALKPLADRGIRVLSGYFTKNSRGDWVASYTLEDEIRDYIARHDGYMHFESGIIFSKVDIVLNEISSIDTVIPTLSSLAENPDTAEVMDLFSHEQGSWSFHSQYKPDHKQRLETAIRWVTEHGYKPVFFDDGFLGKQS